MQTIKWTNEQVFRLLEMFKERELLWNADLEDYRDRNKKHDAWCEIASAFNIERYVLEKKMKSLIGQFQRELKKPKKSDGSDEVLSNWFAFKKMMFLRNRSTPTNRDASLKDRGENNETEQENVPVKEQIKFATPKNLTRKRTLPQLEEKSFDETVKRNYGTQKRDEFDVFGEYVAVKLRQLHSPNAKNTAQYHINNILFSASMGEYDWPSFSGPSSHHGMTNNLRARYSNFGDWRVNLFDNQGMSGSYSTPGPSASSESVVIKPGSPASQSSVDDSTQSFEDILNDIQQ